MFYFDPMYFIFLGPAIILTIWAQAKVKGTFKKYSKIGSQAHVTGADAAARILEYNNINDVKILETKGWLSDHYDPSKKVLKLSPKVYRSTSLASVGIAAHEAGHAIQHAQGYAPLVLRQAIAPAAVAGSNLAMAFLIIGFIMGAMGLVKVGIILFSIAVLFQIITLPVEFNATARAKEQLAAVGILNNNEIVGVNKVLSAAAMTYVAATITAILQLLYFILRVRR